MDHGHNPRLAYRATRAKECNVTWVQATVAQQAEMKKVKLLQEKLGAELVSLSQRMANLQTSNTGGDQVGQLMLCYPSACVSTCMGASPAI